MEPIACILFASVALSISFFCTAIAWWIWQEYDSLTTSILAGLALLGSSYSGIVGVALVIAAGVGLAQLPV